MEPSKSYSKNYVEAWMEAHHSPSARVNQPIGIYTQSEASSPMPTPTYLWDVNTGERVVQFPFPLIPPSIRRKIETLAASNIIDHFRNTTMEVIEVESFVVVEEVRTDLILCSVPGKDGEIWLGAFLDDADATVKYSRVISAWMEVKASEALKIGLDGTNYQVPAPWVDVSYAFKFPTEVETKRFADALDDARRQSWHRQPPQDDESTQPIDAP